jgi:hypothetical protein
LTAVEADAATAAVNRPVHHDGMRPSATDRRGLARDVPDFDLEHRSPLLRMMSMHASRIIPDMRASVGRDPSWFHVEKLRPAPLTR